MKVQNSQDRKPSRSSSDDHVPVALEDPCQCAILQSRTRRAHVHRLVKPCQCRYAIYTTVCAHRAQAAATEISIGRIAMRNACKCFSPDLRSGLHVRMCENQAIRTCDWRTPGWPVQGRSPPLAHSRRLRVSSLGDRIDGYSSRLWILVRSIFQLNALIVAKSQVLQLEHATHGFLHTDCLKTE